MINLYFMTIWTQVNLLYINSLKIHYRCIYSLPKRTHFSVIKHFYMCSVPFSSVAQSVRLFVTPWIAACQASQSITNSQSSLRLTSFESVMPSSHLILCRPLLLLPAILPSIRVFSNESTLRMRWPNVYISCLFSQDKILEIESLEGHSSNTYTELSHMQ